MIRWPYKKRGMMVGVSVANLWKHASVAEHCLGLRGIRKLQHGVGPEANYSNCRSIQTNSAILLLNKLELSTSLGALARDMCWRKAALNRRLTPSYLTFSKSFLKSCVFPAPDDARMIMLSGGAPR